MNAKSRNPAGYNGTGISGANNASETVKEMNYGGNEKFLIGNIPKSTTNKTYSSLTAAINYKENDSTLSNGGNG